MIEKLQDQPSPYGNEFRDSPDNWMLMNKLNEVIEAVNAVGWVDKMKTLVDKTFPLETQEAIYQTTCSIDPTRFQRTHDAHEKEWVRRRGDPYQEQPSWEVGDEFWFLSIEDEDFISEYKVEVLKTTMGVGWDREVIEKAASYNCFRTRSEAENAAKKIEQILRGEK